MAQRKRTDPGEVTISTRVTPEIDQRFDQLAEFHGRSKSEEVRWAMIVFDAMATLDYLHGPEAKAELSPAELRKARKQVEADLHEFTAQALRKAPRLPLYHPTG